MGEGTSEDEDLVDFGDLPEGADVEECDDGELTFDDTTNEMHAVAADEAAFPYGLVTGLVAGFLLLAGPAAVVVLSRRRAPGQADGAAGLPPRV